MPRRQIVKKNSNKNEVLITKEQVRNMFKTLARKEKKYVDTVFTVTPGAGVTYAGLVFTMPAMGNNINTTASENIEILGFDCRFSVINTLTAIPIDLRLTINQQVGENTPTQVDILENPSTGPIAVVSPLAYQNQGKTVKTIWDHYVETDPNWKAVQHGCFLGIKPSIRNCRFSVANGVWTNGLPFFNFWFRQNAAAGIVITAYARMWFQDME